MSLSSLAAPFFGAIAFILFIGAGILVVNNYETLFYETPESVGPNEHYRAERKFNSALWMYVIGIPFLVGLYLARRPQKIKIVKEDKNKDRGNNGEKPRPEQNVKIVKNHENKDKNDGGKPIVYYYAKYIGLQGSNKSLPMEEDSYVHVYDDKIIVELLQLIYKSKVRIIIPYSSVTNLQNVDARNKADLDRVIGLDSIAARVGREVGLLRKR